MGWTKPSESLLDLLEETLEGVDFERRKMFGQWALFLRGHMFAGIFQDAIFVRINPDEQDEVRQLSDEVEQFEPLKGRAMREYLVLPPAIFEDRDIFISVLIEQ
jgi:TfoX/Sxy family transcriptional regulator of competence genes